MRRLRLTLALLLLAVPARTPAAQARTAASAAAAPRAVFLDSAGVIRWRDDRSEVALYGANYAIMSASDFRAAGYVHADRKRLIETDMAHFARMGWTGLRLATWGDWENADSLGNLIPNAHLDLMDYLVARARERGIYMLLTPIQTYDAGWPDSLAKSPTYAGFSRKYSRGELGTKPEAIAAQANYLRQLLNHVNPYTGVAYKDEPSILFIEMINEPWHHPEDLPGSVRYIDALVDAVRSTGARQLLFHNVSQDFAITPAIRRSKVQGVTFGWYPTGLNSGHELPGNHLRSVDAYPAMLDTALARLPRIVYEFDSPDLRTGYMYPAMARTFRAVGAQFAAMFAYDFLGTASRNLGWQTHYLSLAYTPRKAMSAVIAAEAMRRLPRRRQYGAYPANTRFGAFRVSHEENLGELVASDAFLYTGTTRSAPPRPDRLRRVAGVGSSPVVTYEGEGAYFLDRVREGVWRLEVYPDAVPVRDPFVMPNAEKIVTRAISRRWPMRVRLPDLGDAFTVQPVTVPGGAPAAARAAGGRFTVRPGVYVLSARGAVARERLPARLGALAFDEYHAPPADTLPVQLGLEAAREYASGRAITIDATVADTIAPDSVTLWVRAITGGRFRPFPMAAAGGYRYRATLPPGALAEGIHEYAITVARGGEVVGFPEGTHRRPSDWDFSAERLWTLRVAPARAPLRLLTPATDVPGLLFTRIGDAIRQGIYRVVTSGETGEPALHLELPVVDGYSPEDYTASLFVGDRIAARADSSGAGALVFRARGLRAGERLHVTLVEKDGTSWSAAVTLDGAWREHAIPLATLRAARGVLLPLGYPGTWNYWSPPAAGRGGAGDRVRIGDVERLQLSLRREGREPVAAGERGVEVEWVTLRAAPE